MTETLYDADVIVVGGGPAGMMAAGRAAQCGASVLLLEKNSNLGKKLLITGGGRCNLTNTGLADRAILAEKFRGSAKFLFSPFSKFGVDETLAFFHDHSVPTKVEDGGRVFPKNDRSQSMLDAMAAYLREGRVEVRRTVTVSGFEVEAKTITGVRLSDGGVLRARGYVLATGGMSHPETGSTGDGFVWLEELGHVVNHPNPALVPVMVAQPWVSELSGVSFDDAKLTVYREGKRQTDGRGKMLFTHVGVSGPLVLNMSKSIGGCLSSGETTLSFDLMPRMDQGSLDRRFREVFGANLNRQVKNSLEYLMPPAMVPVVLHLSGVDPEQPTNDVRREDRIAMVRFLKDFRLTATGLLGVDKAIVTSGGVTLPEVDFGSMRSRLYPNLYFCGDMLDIDRPSGGYSLQLCWTTGYVAGTAAAADLSDR